jgi:hypothetical protein
MNDAMKPIDHYPLTDLKLAYTVLRGAIREYPDLMDVELLADLQTYLQQEAAAAGIDVTSHAQWTTWLAGGPLLRPVK